MASTANTDPNAATVGAVIIPHYNDTARLDRCLAALGAQDLTAVEVVVVDNGSTEPLAAVKAAHPFARFVVEPEKGAAAARNRGVAETTAPGLFFLDADCVPTSDWLAAALRATAPGTVTGGRVEVFDETPGPRSGAEAFETVFAFHQRAYIEKKGFSVTANLITTRAVFEATGPFRAGVSEDLDWCHRATAAGHRLVYDDRLTVAHPTRRDLTALLGKWRRMTAETFGLGGGGARARLIWAGRACLMPLSVLAHAPRVMTHPALASPGERARALATLARLRLTRSVWMLRQAAGLGL